MATTYLKKAEKTPATGEDETRKIVSDMLETRPRSRAIWQGKELPFAC